MRTPDFGYSIEHFLASMGYTDTLPSFQCRAKFCPNLYHRSVTPQVTDPSWTEPLIKRMARALKIGKRSKRNRDTPPVPLHPNTFARQGKNADFEKDVKEVWFTGAHSGMVFSSSSPQFVTTQPWALAHGNLN
jgi:hypothetical protein